MLKSYITVAIRNLLRYKTYSFINIAGLAIGLTCCIVIALFIKHELSYDAYPEEADRIYRLVHLERGGKDWACLPAPVAPEIKNAFPEISYVRLFPQWHMPMKKDSQIFYEDICFSDSNVFEMFSISLLQGNIETALKAPYSMVITEQVARKFFGQENPIGQILTFNNQHDFKVTGIMEEIPETSHFVFDFLASFGTLEHFSSININNKISHQFYTYLLIPESFPPKKIEDYSPKIIERFYGDNSKFSLQPLRDIHLYSHLEKEMNENSDIAYIYIFTTTALFVLLIACINFMNLTTARSVNRSREVGLRKVIGAYRMQLVKQFLGESILLCFMAFILAIALTEFCLPILNAFLGKNLVLSISSEISVFVSLIVFALIVGIIAGGYPAFYLSAFQPIEVLKGTLKSGRKSILFRRGLVVTQFSVSIILIIVTSIISDQLGYIRSENLGIKKDNVIVIPMSKTAREHYATIKQELLTIPEILNVSASDRIPGVRIGMGEILVEGQLDQERVPVRILWADYDFMETLGIELSQGRDFSKHFATDPEQSFIINQAAMEEFGWKSPIGKQMLKPFSKTLIGVVENFNYASLHHTVEPLIILLRSDIANYILVRSRVTNTPALISSLENTWDRLNLGVPFEYSFLDNYFEGLYRTESSAERILSVFSFVAIMVACMGLLGLVSFSVEQRTKEMGVRKVLGASTFDIIQIHSKEFVKLVIVANLISWPITYLIADQWLQNFAFRIGIGIEPFILASLFAFLAASATVSYHAIKAGAINPLNALRQE